MASDPTEKKRIVPATVAGMRLYIAVIKALIPLPRYPILEVLSINRRGRSMWRRTIVPEASPLADPSIVVKIAARIPGVLYNSGPHPFIESMGLVYARWTKWAESTRQLFDDYAKTDVARVMKDSCIEQFYAKYGINKSITPTHLIQGRMRGVIRRKLWENPFEGERVAMMYIFTKHLEHRNMDCFSKAVHSVYHGPQTHDANRKELIRVVTNSFRNHPPDQPEYLREGAEYIYRYARAVIFNGRVKEMVELLHLWYLVAKHSSVYIHCLNAMMAYRPEAPQLTPA